MSINPVDTNSLQETYFKTEEVSIAPFIKIKEGEEQPDRYRRNDGISGSGQFPQSGLKYLLENKVGNQFLVIDLRQEFHGFINGNPISWRLGTGKDKHGYNHQLDADEIEEKEKELLSQYALNHDFFFETDKGNQNILVQSVATERELVEGVGACYVRIPITDESFPNDVNVDRLIQIIASFPKELEIHLHCAAGRGRTTTVWAMIDMMRDPNSLLEDILIKQKQKKRGSNLLKKSDKLEFLREFYRYCRENPTFSQSWSSWKSQSNLAAFRTGFKRV